MHSARYTCWFLQQSGRRCFHPLDGERNQQDGYLEASEELIQHLVEKYDVVVPDHLGTLLAATVVLGRCYSLAAEAKDLIHYLCNKCIFFLHVFLHITTCTFFLHAHARYSMLAV